MLSMKLRQLFKKGKLYEREWLFYTTICYESPVIRIERIYKKNDKKEKHKMHMMLLDLYFDYEWEWKPLSTRQLWELCWVTHPIILNITKEAFAHIKPNLEPNVQLPEKKIYQH